MPRQPWNIRPVGVSRKRSRAMLSCFTKPFAGGAPSRTISITAQAEAEVVHAIAVKSSPNSSVG